VKVRVSVSGQIVVDSQVDTFNINTTAEDVGGNADTLVELLEFLVAADTVCTRVSKEDSRHERVTWVHIPLLLADTGVHSDRGEVALAEQLVQLSGAKRRLDEDDNLVELEVIKKLVKLTVLLTLIKRDVVLLQTMEGQLGVLVDVVLGRVLHELATDGLDVVGKSGREHHDLLLLRCGPEDLLDITAHV
jgi:hypothetical protein